MADATLIESLSAPAAVIAGCILGVVLLGALALWLTHYSDRAPLRAQRRRAQEDHQEEQRPRVAPARLTIYEQSLRQAAAQMPEAGNPSQG